MNMQHRVKAPSPRARYWLCIYLLLPLSIVLGTSSDRIHAQGICDRSEEVRAALLNALPETDSCNQVTQDSLANIRYLNLSDIDISDLRIHDFNGLFNLVDLNLENSSLSELDPQQFSHLESVEIIRLANNNISALPNGAFSNLPNLRILNLSNNDLDFVEENAFEYLPNLYELDLRKSSADVPLNQILPKLPNLSSLGIDVGQIENSDLNDFSNVKVLHLDPYGSGDQFDNAIAAMHEKGLSGTVGQFELRSSRLFGARDMYPPVGFSAYAIVAFPSGVTEDLLEKYLAICDGYVSTLIASKELALPTFYQLVTIWPLRNSTMADDLNTMQDVQSDFCGDIVEKIDIHMSQEAIRRAEMHLGESFTGVGPYLLAWSPGQRYSDLADDVPVLVLDMSNVRRSEQAVDAFFFWTREIEKDPDVWKNGWNYASLRLKVRWWVDNYGQEILTFFGIST